MSAARETSSGPDNSAGRPLVSAGNSDRCAACGANLAVDQRYCVECGTRRGAPRFQLSSPTGGGAQADRMPATPMVGLTQRVMRSGASAVMLLGLFILLLALGIGVLIGQHGNSKQTTQPVKIVANFGSGSSSGAASTTAASAGSGGSSGSGSSTSKSSKSSKLSKSSSKKSAGSKAKAAAAAATNPNASATGKAGTAAAAKSFGGSATSKSTVNGACTAGTSGCVNGKQTGNLFGG